MDELNINAILKRTNNLPVKIGELTQEVINILKLNCLPKNITLTAERIYHCESHKNQYKDEHSYQKSISSIPEIIKNPDYVGFNKENNSIQYVKQINDVTVVAVRFSNKGSLKLRTMFPLTEFDFNKKLRFNKIIPYNK